MGILGLFGKKKDKPIVKEALAPSKTLNLNSPISNKTHKARLKNGLYPYQVLLLEYCSYGTYPNPKNGYPRFWKTKYGVTDVDKELDTILRMGLIKDENGKFALTDTGTCELNQYEYIPYMHKHDIPGLSLDEMCAIMETQGRSYRDVIWSYLNSELAQFGKYQKWGLYRNTLLLMGDFLMEEDRFLDALMLYSEVAFFDINNTNPLEYQSDKKVDLSTIVPIGVIKKLHKARILSKISFHEYQSLLISRFDELVAKHRILSNRDTVDWIIQISE